MEKVRVRVVEIPWWNRGITWALFGFFLIAACYGLTRPGPSAADTPRVERQVKVVTPTPALLPTSAPLPTPIPPKPIVIGGTPAGQSGNNGITIGVNNGTVNVTLATPKVERVVERIETTVYKPVIHRVTVEKPVVIDHYIRETHTYIPRECKTPSDPRCDQGQREHEARVAQWRKFPQ